jgi:hypothetical protein
MLETTCIAVSTFSTNSTLHGENIHVKSGILSTISTIALALLFTLRSSATIPPQLLLRHPLPQQLRLFVAQNRPFSTFRRSCQVSRSCSPQQLKSMNAYTMGLQ